MLVAQLIHNAICVYFCKILLFFISDWYLGVKKNHEDRVGEIDIRISVPFLYWLLIYFLNPDSQSSLWMTVGVVKNVSILDIICECIDNVKSPSPYLPLLMEISIHLYMYLLYSFNFWPRDLFDLVRFTYFIF